MCQMFVATSANQLFSMSVAVIFMFGYYNYICVKLVLMAFCIFYSLAYSTVYLSFIHQCPLSLAIYQNPINNNNNNNNNDTETGQRVDKTNSSDADGLCGQVFQMKGEYPIDPPSGPVRERGDSGFDFGSRDVGRRRDVLGWLWEWTGGSFGVLGNQSGQNSPH